MYYLDILWISYQLSKFCYIAHLLMNIGYPRTKQKKWNRYPMGNEYFNEIVWHWEFQRTQLTPNWFSVNFLDNVQNYCIVFHLWWCFSSIFFSHEFFMLLPSCKWSLIRENIKIEFTKSFHSMWAFTTKNNLRFWYRKCT